MKCVCDSAKLGKVVVGLDTEINYVNKVCLLQIAVFLDTRKEVYMLNMGELAGKLKCVND